MIIATMSIIRFKLVTATKSKTTVFQIMVVPKMMYKPHRFHTHVTDYRHPVIHSHADDYKDPRPCNCMEAKNDSQDDFDNFPGTSRRLCIESALKGFC